MADAPNPLLLDSLNRSIVDESTKLAAAANSNHTSQLNNFSRAAEVLSKRIAEVDTAESVAESEMISRISPVSQGHVLGQTLTQVGGAMQNNQNYIIQGFAQMTTMLDLIATKLAAISK